MPWLKNLGATASDYIQIGVIAYNQVWYCIAESFFFILSDFILLLWLTIHCNKLPGPLADSHEIKGFL